MADPRIYTGAEALALLETLTPGPWDAERADKAEALWHEVTQRLLAAEASDRQASETCADLRRQLLVMTAERDALRAAATGVVEVWKVTEVQCDESGACEDCGAKLGERHVDALCDELASADSEALMRLRAQVGVSGTLHADRCGACGVPLGSLPRLQALHGVPHG